MFFILLFVFIGDLWNMKLILSKIPISVSIWSNILSVKEVLQLLLTKHYFLNLESKFPVGLYTNVSMDPLGTACTSLGIHGSQFGNHQYMQILDHCRGIRFKRFLCLRIEEELCRLFWVEIEYWLSNGVSSYLGVWHQVTGWFEIDELERSGLDWACCHGIWLEGLRMLQKRL